MLYGTLAGMLSSSTIAMDTTSRYFLWVGVVLVLMVEARRAQNPAGVCPPPVGSSICSFLCDSDDECAPNMKCCTTTCGGTLCLRPVTAPQRRNRVKAGSCPANPTGPWVCSNRCSTDGDCRGSQKCCRNRCGALACQKPTPSRRVVFES